MPLFNPGTFAPAGSQATYSKRLMRTSGNITANGTSWANLDTGLDLTLSAAAGHWVEVGVNGLWNNDNVFGCLDAVSLVSGSPVSTWSHGAAEDNAQFGVQGWLGPFVGSAPYYPISGGIPRLLVAGDISNATVTIRFRVRTNTATNKILLATAAQPLVVWARNHG
jgi:hypothetical protein